MKDLSFHDFLSPVLLSIKISLIASLIVFVLGTAAAWKMARASFPGKTVVETLFLLPLVLPPTVVGFLLLVMLGRNSWIGKLAEKLFDAPIVFSWWAAVTASVVVAFPLVYQTIKVGFSSVDKNLQEAARSFGAGEWQVFRRIMLPLAKRSLAAAYILGFARGLGEFGATLMIAGNIPHKTQTVPTAIYIAVESGNMALAWWWTSTIISLSFLLMLVVNRKNLK